MSGKVLVIAILLSALIAGGALYYLQIYGYYEEVAATSPEAEIRLTRFDGTQEALPVEGFEGIDAASSPIRFRACFTTPVSQAMLSETFAPYERAEPLVAPGWFDCFDAIAIAEGLRSGAALPFLGEKNIAYGVDRLVVVFDDGRAYAWHQLNDCGEKAYDGTPVGEACPTRE
ncbi:DUF6446 family protein [Poseidonocella sedimentorum]|uniref:Histidine kinase n=1 Tax=Poseidonocella sedimentorum TaxID=871652 RepID=A0A1I6DYG5_9RHOB|nr:DUF6446 family protein [Poseidonocella sedimentorum]SFR10564.1 hypothetical protein SAMN04515673_10684 [Poseidonocella sedimentorum]